MKQHRFSIQIPGEMIAPEIQVEVHPMSEDPNGRYVTLWIKGMHGNVVRGWHATVEKGEWYICESGKEPLTTLQLLNAIGWTNFYIRYIGEAETQE